MDGEYFFGLYFNELCVVGLFIFGVCVYAVIELFCGTTWQYPTLAEARAEWEPRSYTDEEDPSIVGLGSHADGATELPAETETAIRTRH